MAEIILTAIIMGIVVTIMAVGVLAGRKPITGSCGGVGQALGEEDYVCELCGNDPNKCEDISKDKSNSTLSYDASK